MRKLIYAINLTVDGCCDHTKVNADEELHEFHTKLLRDSDTFVYGRKTYELMVPFWPDMAKSKSDEAKDLKEFAQAFDSVRKIVVFSKTLKRAGYEKTSIVSTDLKSEILKLKQQEGKHILTGGVDLPMQLIELGLIDEFYFIVQPLVVGEGRRLFDNAKLQKNLQFIDSQKFKSGSVALHYKQG